MELKMIVILVFIGSVSAQLWGAENDHSTIFLGKDPFASRIDSDLSDYYFDYEDQVIIKIVILQLLFIFIINMW